MTPRSYRDFNSQITNGRWWSIIPSRMTDLHALLHAIDALPAGEPAALATVVRVQGSSYRLPGARMLVDAAGRRTGSVSGGCLEADVARRGRLLTDAEPSQLVNYDSNDIDAAWGFGLGCNGSIDVFIERLADTRAFVGRSPPMCERSRSRRDRNRVWASTASCRCGRATGCGPWAVSRSTARDRSVRSDRCWRPMPKRARSMDQC